VGSVNFDFDDFMEMLSRGGRRPDRPTPWQFALMMLVMALVSFFCALAVNGIFAAFFVFCGIVFIVPFVRMVIRAIIRRRNDWGDW
jgi:hypothetical protein